MSVCRLDWLTTSSSKATGQMYIKKENLQKVDKKVLAISMNKSNRVRTIDAFSGVLVLVFVPVLVLVLLTVA